MNSQLQNQFRNIQNEHKVLKEQQQLREQQKNHLQVPQENRYVVNSSSDFNDRDRTFMEQFEVENREQLRKLQEEHQAQHHMMMSKVTSVDKLPKNTYKTPTMRKEKVQSNNYGYSTIEHGNSRNINVDNSIDDKLSQAASVVRSRRDYLERIRPKSSREQKKIQQMNVNQDRI